MTIKKTAAALSTITGTTIPMRWVSHTLGTKCGMQAEYDMNINYLSINAYKKLGNLSLINNCSLISVIIDACLVSSKRLLNFL